MSEQETADGGLDAKAQDQEERAMADFADAAGNGIPADAALRQAIGRFPAQAALLADYAAHLQVGAAEAEESIAALEALVDRIAAAKMELRISELNGLLARLKELARSPADVCRRLHIGRSVLTKMDRRLIDAASIPEAFLRALGEELLTTREALAAFLSAGPRLSAVAEYRAKGAPSAGRKASFQSAVEASIGAGEIASSEADRWLAEKRDPA